MSKSHVVVLVLGVVELTVERNHASAPCFSTLPQPDQPGGVVLQTRRSAGAVER